MALNKTIALGDVGSLVLSEAGGVASVTVTVNASAGGGSVAGAAKASLSAQASLSAAQLIDAGLALAESKYPSAAAEIALLKSLVDAELSQV